MSTNPRLEAVDEASAPVLVQVAESVGRIILNRPDCLNAMNEAMMDGLLEAFERVARDPDVRCVVLEGAGRAFSSGGDVHMMRRRQEAAQESSLGARVHAEQLDLERRGRATVLLRTMNKPTMAVLQGHVVGGAVALALACDLRIASRSTRIRIGFASRGLSGDFGTSHLLVSTVGDAKARELLMLDPIITGDDAHGLGLVTKVVDDPDLPGEAARLEAALRDGPTIAFARMKANLEAVDLGLGLAQSIRTEAANQRVAALTDDSAESARAFQEGRDARFKGE